MQKPLTCDRQGFAIEKLNSILSQILQKSRSSESSNYISDRRLTESVEILENVGFTGDLAIFIIASLQILEVGA
ncbi:hypothetical protein [Nostoc sp. ATCC 53789]|uniref:hypothetical protein n=1 Tax=Nostoc sp. ATCC 53789 TaxID=76335 RepID=UPI000DEC4CB2|nr:hypothetical protein [Nostoc sp. ATCC 53789]QHG21064.1 hypothetical protein GJB62_35005 [Nostoc sp. ATCC 53789]RCJ16836.1 hypothetical protein A6V25_30185 [Nostoc sp. ATCC 53789]